MTEHKLLILSEDAEAYWEIINNTLPPGLIVKLCHDCNPGDKHLQECDIIFGTPDLVHQALPYAGNVKWVQSMWAGVGPLLKPGMRRDYLLTGVKDIFGRAMAEYVICHILMHERKSIARYNNQLKKKWDATPPGMLQGKRVGIMGLGSIGRTVAGMVKHFGVETLGFSRSRTACENIDRCYLPHNILDFVKDLDYLACILPDTPETQGMIDRHVLENMKNTVLIINAGRGSLIDVASLVDALENQTIAGAVLDVFVDEPLSAEHPLWQTPNTIITSHTAAMTFPETVTPIFIDNYHSYKNGKQMKYLIDFESGY